MRKYVIFLTGTAVLFLISIGYRHQNTTRNMFHHFPIPESLKKNTTVPPLYIFLFFSEKSCTSCVIEFVDILNNLPAEYCVAGIIPEKELRNRLQIKRSVGAAFPLFGNEKYKKLLPMQTPVLFGVSPSGRVLLVLPAINGQSQNVKINIESLYGNLYSFLEREYAGIVKKKGERYR